MGKESSSFLLSSTMMLAFCIFELGEIGVSMILNSFSVENWYLLSGSVRDLFFGVAPILLFEHVLSYEIVVKGVLLVFG